MREADARLKALFAADEPPARDPAFSAAVLARVARRQCLEDIALLAAVSALGGAALWGLWPGLGPALAQLAGALAPTAVVLAAALSAAAVLAGQSPPASAAES